MIKNYFLLLFLTIANFSIAQIKTSSTQKPGPIIIDNSLVIFQYDESGNQIYRGPQKGFCPTCRDQKSQLSSSLADQVGNKIQAAPVPVKTDLNIVWDLSVRDYILKIDLLPYNSFNIMASVDIKSLTENSYIFRMSNFPYGVYYLKFYLIDGSTYTRTITKN